jgi:hypothetical protein
MDTTHPIRENVAHRPIMRNPHTPSMLSLIHSQHIVTHSRREPPKIIAKRLPSLIFG